MDERAPILAFFDVEEGLCMGCGLCEFRAPENLELPAGEWVARVVRQPIDEEELSACIEAADYCPTGGLHRVAVE